jgi:uncharacterized protein (TIGR02246 family)
MNALIVTMMLTAGADVQTELTGAINKWADAYNSRDLKALAALYTDDVQYIYAFAGDEGKGKKALEAFYAAGFKAPTDLKVKMVSYEVTPMSDTVAFGAGVWEDSLNGPDGKRMTVPTHSSEIFVKKGGKWLVKVDHASFVPPPQPAAKQEAPKK